jgi:hypothetical protein
MKKKPFALGRPSKGSPGFALIVAMTLMAFLVMLLVGVSTLVRTETQAATIQQLQAMAKVHARMGLKIAIAELQRVAGQDQRVTGNAMLLDTDEESLSPDGVEQPYWTGVWQMEPLGGGNPGDRQLPWGNNSQSANSNFDPHPVMGKEPGFPKGRAHWLVTWNEGLDANTDADRDFFVEPTMELADPGVDFAHPAPGRDGTVQSVWMFNHPSNPYAQFGGAADTRVKVLRRPIEFVGADTPADQPALRGHYAYFVADEGVKARINLTDPFEGASPSDAETRFRTVAQRTGFENVELDLGGSAVRLSDYFEANEEQLRWAFDEGQVALAAKDPALIDDAQNALRAASHHFTAYSMGLQTDTRNGGFKRDLSLAFAMSDGDFNDDPVFAATDEKRADGTPNINGISTGGGIKEWFERHEHTFLYQVPSMPKNGKGFGTYSSEEVLYGPTWHLMRDYYRMYEPADGDFPLGNKSPGANVPVYDLRTWEASTTDPRNRSLSAQAFHRAYYRYSSYDARTNFLGGTQGNLKGDTTYTPRPTRMHLAPVVSHFTLMYSIARNPSSEPDTPDTQLQLITEPHVAFWNPYNVAIEVDAIHVELRPDSGAQFVLETELRDWEPMRRYRLFDEVISEDKIYQFVNNTKADFRKGVNPANGDDLDSAESYALDPDGNVVEFAREKKDEAGNTVVDGGGSPVMEYGPLIWEILRDSSGNPIDPDTRYDAATDQYYRVAALVNNEQLAGTENRMAILSRDAFENQVNGDRINGRPTPIRFEPGEVKIFAPGNEEPLGAKALDSKKTFLGTVLGTTQPDGGYRYPQWRNRHRDLDDDKYDPAVRGSRNGSMGNGFDEEVEVEEDEHIRLTAGGWNMDGEGRSVLGAQTFEEVYTAGIQWDGRATGNDGQTLRISWGIFKESGPWRAFDTRDDIGTFYPLEALSGFEIRHNYGAETIYRNPSTPAPEPFIEVVPGLTPLPRWDDGSPPFKYVVGKMDWYLKTEDDNDLWPVRVLADFNPRYRINSGGQWGTLGYGQTAPHYQILSDDSFQGVPTEWPIQSDFNNRGFWGPSNTSLGEPFVTLYDIPRGPLLSVGAFQHVPVEPLANTPAQAIGNSWASPSVGRAFYSDFMQSKQGNPMSQSDVSWIANEALFDSYWFSSLVAHTQDGTSYTAEETFREAFSNPDFSMPNSRVRPYLAGDLDAQGLEEISDPFAIVSGAPRPYETSAAYFMVDGTFNVNSTSVEAWVALLSSLNELDVAYLDPATGSLQSDSDVRSPFMRTSTPLAAFADSTQHDPQNNADRFWAGYRSLTPEQIRDLAEAIVEEVKVRGPFLSLADFVNRRLVADDATDLAGRDIAYTGISGTLQTAIDKTLNGGSATGINEGFLPIDEDRMNLARSVRDNDPFPFEDHFLGRYEGGDQGYAAASSAGFLSQSDLLQVLAPVLSARSDTFRIRAYGDVVNPLTGETEARAWCEAIVQRVPEYVDESNDPWEMPYVGSSSQGALNHDDLKRISPVPLQDGLEFDLEDIHENVQVDRNSNLAPANQIYGRKFRVVSFRWLAEDEV